MSLKKSDKIIAIIGVLIIVIAGIGIVFYWDDGEETDDMGQEGDMGFEVEWIKYTDEMVITGQSVSKTAYEDPIEINGLEEGSILTMVYVQITWEDDRALGKIFNKGLDILTATIGLVGGESKDHTSEGFGNQTLDFLVNDAPLSTTEKIEDVESLSEARDKIELENEGKNTATFDVNILVEKGEKLITLRPRKLLNYFLDKGNDFQLKVTYEYYTPDITKVEDGNNPDDDMPPTETGVAHIGQMVIMGQGRW